MLKQPGRAPPHDLVLQRQRAARGVGHGQGLLQQLLKGITVTGGQGQALGLGHKRRHAAPLGQVQGFVKPARRLRFVATGAQSMARIRQLRAFAGAPLPLPIQRVSEAAWNDEAHVAESLALYQDKFRMADEVFAGQHNRVAPEGGFFLWLPVPDGDGEAAALQLWRETGVRVLPGAYLSRDVGGANPGKAYIRVALVAPQTELQHGLIRLRDCLYH